MMLLKNIRIAIAARKWKWARMTEYKYISKKGGLKDNAIIMDLTAAVEMYENGEILEVRDILFDIVESINEWERNEDE